MAKKGKMIIKGTISNYRWCRAQTNGQWTVMVTADLVPSAGEDVYVASNPLTFPAAVVYVGTASVARIPLTRTTGNTYTGSMPVGPNQPTSVVIETRFIAAVQTQAATLQNSCPP